MSNPDAWSAFATAAKPCEGCGKEFRGGRNRRCAACRAIDRKCASCGTSFRGIATRCPACSKPVRNCITCGASFKGTSKSCSRCNLAGKPARICVDCGASYTPNNSRKCGKCRQPLQPKPCTECGESFTGSALRCHRCRAVEQVCGCGRTFRDRGRSACAACRAVERACADCGRVIKSAQRKCSTCQARPRDCIECGVSFRGQSAHCNRCKWAGKPYEERCVRALVAVNKRRALQRAAEVAGPVPAVVYAALRAERACVYCDEPNVELDHVRPLSRGGWEHEGNLVPSCTACNRSKGHKLLTSWDPVRVAHGAARSPKVAAEWARLLSA